MQRGESSEAIATEIQRRSDEQQAERRHEQKKKPAMHDWLTGLSTSPKPHQSLTTVDCRSWMDVLGPRGRDGGV